MLASVITKENLLRHAVQLQQRKFTPGFDSVTAAGAMAQLQIQGDRLCRELRDGAYSPMPAIGFRTAKRRGGYRRLFRLTAPDTIIQNVFPGEYGGVTDRRARCGIASGMEYFIERMSESGEGAPKNLVNAVFAAEYFAENGCFDAK